MRKFYFYLTFLILAVTGQSAWAQVEGFAYGYCSDNINPISFETEGNYLIAGAFQLTEADVEKYDGCEITGVSIGFGSGRNKAVTVFFTDDLKGTPFRTIDGRVRPSQWNDIPVEGGVKLEKGRPIYVGYKYEVQNSTSVPLGCDDNTTTYSENADWVSAGYTEEELSAGWRHLGSQVGNVCIRVYLKGNTLPTANCVPQNIELPSLAYPGKPFKFSVTFTNASAEAVNNVEVVYQIGEDPEQTVEYTFDTPVSTNAPGTATFTAQTMQDGFGLPVWARISKVNGTDNDMADRRVGATLVCTDKFFKRKVVVEKYSGVRCGYCPRGIVAFEYMNENYPDKFIGITLSNYTPTDPMFCSYYETFLNNVMNPSGAPNVFVNRNNELTRVADKGAVESAVLSQYTDACEIGVTASFEKGDVANTVNATGTVEVTHDIDDADLSVTFVVVEDNVGPYQQANNFSGTTGCPEWADKPYYVSTIYDDVARYIHPDYNGIAGSVPTTLKAGEKYAYTVKNMSLGNTNTFDNAALIVLLIDNKTKQVVNADRCRFNGETDEPKDPEIPDTGIEHVKADDFSTVSLNGRTLTYQGAGIARVYSVSGTLEGTVGNSGTVTLAPGVYVVKTMAGARKVLVK